MRRGVPALAALVATLTLLRVWFCSRLALIPDEAYYWTWSRRLDVCYFDQPGMIAWSNALSQRLLGGSPLALRAPALLLGVLGVLLIYLTALELWQDRRRALLAAAAFNFVPLFAAGTVLIIHDTALSFFWLLALYAAARLRNDAGPRNYLLLAAAVLGALYSKLNAALLAGMLALAILVAPRLRSSLRRPWPWLAALLVAIGFAPVLIWNARHQWITVLVVDKLGHKGHADFGLALRCVAELVFSQFVLVPPALLGLPVALSALRRRRKDADSPELLLALLSLPMLLYFVLIALRTEVQANWPALALPPLVLLAVHRLVQAHDERHGPALRVYGTGLFAASALLTVLMHVQALHPLLPVADIIRAMGMPQRARDLTDQSYGWDDLARRVQFEIEASPDPQRTIVGSRNYQIASELEYLLPGRPQTVSLNYNTKGNDYDLRTDYHALNGWTMIEVEPPGMSLTSRFRKHFSDCPRLRALEARCSGCDVRLAFNALGGDAVELLGWQARRKLADFRPQFSCCERLEDFEFRREGRVIAVSQVWRCRGFGIEGEFAEYFNDPLSTIATRLREKRELQ